MLWVRLPLFKEFFMIMKEGLKAIFGVSRDFHVGQKCNELKFFGSNTSTTGEISKIMEKNKIRHVPILDGKRCIGIISDRDLKLIAGLGNGDDTKASDLMTKDVYIVSHDTSLSDVLEYFMQKKIDSAIVDFKDGRLGIFTSHDAIKVLVEQSNKK